MSTMKIMMKVTVNESLIVHTRTLTPLFVALSVSPPRVLRPLNESNRE